jgi:hypothetical protein
MFTVAMEGLEKAAMTWKRKDEGEKCIDKSGRDTYVANNYGKMLDISYQFRRLPIPSFEIENGP